MLASMISKLGSLIIAFLKGMPMIADHPKSMTIISPLGKIIRVDVNSAELCDVYFKGIRSLSDVGTHILQEKIYELLAVDTDIIWGDTRPTELFIIHSAGVSKVPFDGTRGQLELLAYGLGDFDLNSAKDKLNKLTSALPVELLGKYVK